MATNVQIHDANRALAAIHGEPTQHRRGSGTHHARKAPRAQLDHLLATCLAHYELNQPRHDELARHYARELMTGLHKLGVLT